jgi:superfamily II DNA helicase RecQ
MPDLSTVRKYKPEEVDLNVLAGKASQVYGKQPFKWQLDIATAILCGEDVIVDVGTGSGKTLCFSLPLLLDEKDINLTVSPLTALMVDQVRVNLTISYNKQMYAG